MTTIFLQVPKTGGTTLKAIIRRQYNDFQTFDTSSVIEKRYSNWIKVPNRIRWEYARRALADLSDGRKRALEMVMGHLWYGWHDIFADDCRYITYLRHPLERYISFYNYIRGFDKHPLGREIRSEDYGIRELMNQTGANLASLQHNIQVKLLAGKFEETNETLLKAATNIRDHFAFVGLTETFDSDLLRLRDMMSWSPPFYVRRNVSTKYISLGDLRPTTALALIERNKLDIALYELVRGARRTETTSEKTRNAAFRFANRAVLPLLRRLSSML